MLQTSPSGPALGALSLDSTPRGGVERSGSNADDFSQEYDKQVKNVESREQGNGVEESRPPVAQGRDEVEDKPEVTAESGQVPSDDSDERLQAASEEQQSGNTLPLEQMRKLAAEAQLQAESQGEDEAVEPRLQQGELAEQQDAAAEESTESMVTIIAQPLQETARVASDAVVAAGVKEVTAQKSESATKTAVAAAGLTSEELAAEEGELPELQLKQQGKEGDFTALQARQSKEGRGGEMMPRGDRGFDAMLNSMPGRGASAAASIDTLVPTLAPLVGQGAANPLATPAPVAMTLAMPMQQANWGGAVAERVVWMTNANIQEAEIQLNPRELGPIGIKVTLNNDQTNVSFVAQNATTREALEAALPRLREMLNENGLQLGQSDVSQHSFKGRDGEAEDGDGRGENGSADEILEGEGHLPGEQSAHGVGYATPAGLDAFA